MKREEKEESEFNYNPKEVTVMNKVSVIIPAYNASPFIEKCINSVFNQSYSNLEIIVVNDGSTDTTPEILNKLSNIDGRLKVISKKNGGVSSARNTGLLSATGDFVTFVDADDDMPYNAVETMLSLMSDDVDMVVCSNNMIRLRKDPQILQNARYKANEINDNFIKFDETVWWPWGKLFRRSVITDNNLEYDTSLTFGEDHVFNLLFAKHMKGDAVISDKIVYNYYIIRNGLCSKYYPQMNEFQKYIYTKIVDYFEDIPRNYEKYYAGNYVKGCVDYYLSMAPLSQSVNELKRTFELFSDILDDEIINEYFTPEQSEFIRNKKFSALAKNYILHNPQKTIIRKLKRTVRHAFEKIQMVFLKKA